MLSVQQRRLLALSLSSLGSMRVHRLFPRLHSAGVVFMLHRVDSKIARSAFAPNRHLTVTPSFIAQVIQLTRRLGWDIVSIDEAADLTANIESMDITGTKFVLEYKGGKEKITTPLLGSYNVSNHLAAAGLCIGAGLTLEQTAKGLSQLKLVPGRLERIDWEGDFSVLVDYAHTDDAMKNVLSTLKGLCKGRLCVVFGCGGNRDKTKRPRMARVAEQYADLIFVTSDNPRNEEPAAIIGEIMAGFENPTADTIRAEVGRKKAIERAIRTAKKDDIIVIAGKGHENYQIIGDKKLEFSDRQTACEYLKKLK